MESNKKFLLSYSLELASIKNWEMLLKVINVQLKDLLKFSYSTICLFNDNRGLIKDFLYDQGSLPEENPFCQHANTRKLTVNNGINSQPSGSSIPVIFNFDEMLETWNVSHYLNDEEDIEKKEGLILKLYQGSEVIGHWVLLYETHILFEKDQLEFIQLLANQLALVVVKIKANDAIVELQKETEILQSLNIDFALIREKTDLLNVIHHKLNHFFDFGHHWVATINDDELTMTSFLQDTESNAKNHPKFQKALTHKYPISDGIFNKALLSKDPVIFDLDQLAARTSLPEYMQILHDSGVKKIIMIGLQVGSKTIGIWGICLAGNQQMDRQQLQLVKNISNQLSIAVDNIRINEAMEAKEAERSLLLQLSFDITTIRSKSDLSEVIAKDFCRLLDFTDITVVICHGRECHDTLLFTHDQLNDSDREWKKSSGQPAYLETCFDKIRRTEEIVIFDIEQLYHQPDVPGNIKAEFERGIKEKAGIALQGDEGIIGLFFVNTRHKSAYSEHQLNLIKGVSYQLSTAISNILANEEIDRREKERELLLSLSIDIAAVRNTNELLGVITQRLKNILGFSHTVIATVNDDQTTVSAFLLDPEAKTKDHPTYLKAKESKYPINDGIFDKAAETAAPVVFDLEQLNKEIVLPLYLKINFETGLRQMIVVRFSRSIRVFGFWIIFFDQKISLGESMLSLVGGLANQISVAVSNIIANEDVSRREQEKALFLSFSNDIATVRDKKGLGLVIKRYLKNLFLIKEYIITIKNDDHETYSYFLHELEADTPADNGFQIITGTRMPIAGSMTGVVLQSEEPVIFDIADVLQQGKLSFPSASFWKSAGAERILGLRLRVASEDIGILWIQPGHTNDHLLKGITAQMAIALANAIANDRIEKQLSEINHYKQQLEEEKIYLKEEIETSHNNSEIVGDSPCMQKIFRLVAQVAPSDSTVLILGETGTGKELIARAIHNNSPRKNKLMVKVNCAALPANLIESELFGHERGSFTGATERRLGKFELANNGTLFLDEIGEMPPELQVKMLRALQEKEIERVGGKSTIKVDVRIIAATNRDLGKEMAEGRFRSDLYYRLNIFPIDLPPLRERRADIPVLASHFILHYAKKTGRKIETLSSRAMQELVQYDWPGNIRELEHLIERSILLTSGDMIKQIHLPPPKQAAAANPSVGVLNLKTVDDNERDHILEILKYCSGRISGEGGAAEILGVPSSTLNSKIKRLGIQRKHVNNHS
ncbi:sigma-54-dependent Fis family transcriptional regulator [Mucilaginibacter sp.]|uniref:sigma-54-dependent Fis family transcriptional regulator n=1 Tax=Mucilaginibacter sp. TaxID=1882438 RepID=UPI002627010A|nr:sigma-54-dependent Fis family transcriptional regulator [Mucilaginibacter sp.]MDB4923244.1 transcriptional regulator, NifA subfamily, Fis Family [Mucilaginibacter sp.]